MLNTKQVSELISKARSVKSIHHTTLSRYIKEGLLCEHERGGVGGHDPYMWSEGAVNETIPKILHHEKEKVERKTAQNKAKTQRAKDNIKCKEPKSYTNAFNLMNKCLHI